MSEGALLRLIERAALRLGYRREAIPYAAALQLLKARFPLGLGSALDGRHRDFDDAPSAGDDALTRALLEAISVGETFFFRQPEHFRYLAEQHDFASALAGQTVRAWSAGCSSGEEAYSLAACLSERFAGSRTSVEVLGTDVSERNVNAARQGVYGSWSVREAGPQLHATFRPGDGGVFAVREGLRAITAFRLHNVLDEPPEPGRFDVIFCRNVLLYFASDAAQTAVDRLTAALAPGGIVAFGSLDLEAVPRGLIPVGPGGSNLFVRAASAQDKSRTRTSRRASLGPGPRTSVAVGTESARPLKSKPSRAPASMPPRGSAKTSRNAPPNPGSAHELGKQGGTAASIDATRPAIAQHLEALAAIEGGNVARAEVLLEALRTTAQNYLPGLFELAVLLAKRGERSRAEALMKELLRVTSTLDPQSPVVGPSDLTVAYYRVAAEAYLGFTPQKSRP